MGSTTRRSPFRDEGAGARDEVGPGHPPIIAAADGRRRSVFPARVAGSRPRRPARSHRASTESHASPTASCRVPCWASRTPAGTLAIHAVPGPRTDGSPPDSVFFLASVTKPIVATAVMQLVDEGRLDLHAPIVALCAGIRRRCSGPGDRLARADPHVGHPGRRPGAPDPGPAIVPKQLADGPAREPAFEPGSRYAVRVQFLLPARGGDRRRSPGMSFPDALRRRVLAPLGMMDTSFDPRPQRPRTQQVHGVRVDNFVTRELMVRFLASATLPGGGSVRAGRGPAAVRPLAAAARHRRRAGAYPVPGGDRRDDREQTGGVLGDAGGWHRPSSPTTGSAGTRRARTSHRSGKPTRWRCTGCGCRPRPARSRTRGASGTRLWVDPDRDLVFVLLSNQWGGSSVPAFEILAAVYRGWPGPTWVSQD